MKSNVNWVWIGISCLLAVVAALGAKWSPWRWPSWDGVMPSVLPALAMASIAWRGEPAPASRPELVERTLYNGIELQATWPPQN